MSPQEDSFTRWARERQLTLLRTALLLTGDRGRAEDLVQEALTKVAQRWGRLEHGHPEAYARRILARDHVSWWRRHRREVLGRDDPAGQLDRGADAVFAAAPTDRTHMVDRRLALERALGDLTPRQRAVVVLRFYADLTEADAADALGVSVGTVKSQTHLALRRLRERAPHLAELIGEPS